MDICYFFKSRVDFVRQFYDTASKPYVERKRMITSQEGQFVPPYSEDGEPAFLDEWIEADESLHVLAYSCISMLASALHLYLESWVRQSRIPINATTRKVAFKNGWLGGYAVHFFDNFQIDFTASPANVQLLEEVILARNSIAHPSSITSHRAQYSNSDFKKLRSPFFVSETEFALFADIDGDKSWMTPATVHVSEEQLSTAISEIENFAEWFEKAIISATSIRK